MVLREPPILHTTSGAGSSTDLIPGIRPKGSMISEQDVVDLVAAKSPRFHTIQRGATTSPNYGGWAPGAIEGNSQFVAA